MATWTTEEEEIITKVLEEGGACRKCCHRFLGYRSSSLYKSLHKKETELVAGSEEPASKISKPNPCVVCLGIMQDAYMMPRMQQIISQIKGSGYDADKFTLSLSLPISLTIREHSLWLYLEDKCKDSLYGRFTREDVVPVKQVWKYIYPELVEQEVGLALESGDIADFFVELVVLWEKDEEEMKVMAKVCPKEYRERAHKVNVYNMGVYSRQGVEKSLENVGYKSFAAHTPVPPEMPSEPFKLDFRMSRNSIFIGGRYCKYSRNLPQTPWLIKGVRKCVTSVEEIIGDRLKDYLKADQVKFLASGREDVDVRMLGTGRPFAFECVNSKKTKFSEADLKELEEYINKHYEVVQVNSLAVVSKSSIKRLKEGEEQKRKRYTALCVTKDKYDLQNIKKLEDMKDFVIKQETPIRVLHRRSNAVRDKMIHEMSVEKVSDTLFKLGVISGAGAYIKELVHGDFGRTVPCLKTLLDIETDILALDVEEVLLDWPNEAHQNGR